MLVLKFNGELRRTSLEPLILMNQDQIVYTSTDKTFLGRIVMIWYLVAA